MSKEIKNIQKTEKIFEKLQEKLENLNKDTDLDHRNWVWDFGGMKRAKTLIDFKQPKEWMDFMFDHTVIVAEDDPELDYFKAMDKAEIIQLRIIEATGAEKFAEFIFNKLNEFVHKETHGRVRIAQVEFMEHGKNTAIYKQ